ncbi:MAG: zinc ribbon domain-containing protein [Gemmatimonadaceae bacterium]|nr:zinc ribbon domain-containing protein [Gemmatimonadaceae bacterium]
MPTYEFVCPDGHTFEKFYRKISDAAAELPCSVCGKVAARKVSGGAGLVFKGSGFYITDYGKDGKKGQPTASSSAQSGEKSGGDAKSNGSSGSTSSSESKPAASTKSSSSE